MIDTVDFRRNVAQLLRVFAGTTESDRTGSDDDGSKPERKNFKRPRDYDIFTTRNKILEARLAMFLSF